MKQSLQTLYQIKLLLTVAAVCGFSIACKSTKARPQEIIKKLSKSDQYMELSQDVWQPIKDKSESAFYFMVGEHKFLKNDLVKSSDYFVSSYNLDPNPFVAERVLRTDIVHKDLAKSLLLGKKMVLLFPQAPELKTTFASLLALTNNDVLVEKQLKESLALDPYQETAYFLLLQTYQKQRSLKDIKKLAEDWVKYSPRSAIPYNILAKIFLSKKNFKKALQYSSVAYNLKPRSIENMLLYALCLDFNKQSDQSILLYEKLFKIVPDNLRLVQHMSQLYESLGEGFNAIAVLDQFISKNKKSDISRLKLHKAILLLKYNRNDEAAAILTKLYSKNPDDPSIRYFAGFSFEHMGDLEQAFRIYEGLRNIKNFETASLLRIAELHKKMQRLDSAIESLRTYLKTNDRKPRVWSFLSSLYEQDKDYENAVVAIRKAVKLDASNPDFLFLEGVYLERLERIDASIAAMNKVIAVDASYSAAYNFIGFLYLERNRSLPEAKILIEKALQLKPNDPYYLDSLGWYYFLVKDYSLAEKFLLAAYKQLPKEDEINEHLAFLYIAKNNLLKAKQYIDFLKASKDFEASKLEKLERAMKRASSI